MSRQNQEELKRLDELYELGKFGIEVENFIASPMGQYIVDRAEESRKAAVEKFKTADVTNQAEILKLQNEIKIPEKVLEWLSEAISAGQAAHDQLDQAEAELRD